MKAMHRGSGGVRIGFSNSEELIRAECGIHQPMKGIACLWIKDENGNTILVNASQASTMRDFLNWIGDDLVKFKQMEQGDRTSEPNTFYE